MNINQKYILKGREVVATNNLLEWATWFEKATRDGERHVAKTTLDDGTWISTVFLGLDHNFGVGEPLLFETMAFKDGDSGEDRDMERYSTYDEAEQGHEKMVKKWKHKYFK